MPIELLPERLKGPARRLRKLMLTDSGVLIILGVFFLARGIGYLTGGGAPGIPAQLLPFPGWVWALVWCVTGIVAVCCAKWWESPIAGAALYVMAATLGLWGAAFILVSPAAFLDRGSGFLTIVVLAAWAVWRGRRTEISVRVNDKGVADAFRPNERR